MDKPLQLRFLRFGQMPESAVYAATDKASKPMKGALSLKEIKNLDDMMNGAVTERFNAALKTCLKNIIDPNTSATTKRKVTLEVTITPSKDRTSAEFSLLCKPTLAPPVAVTQSMVLNRDDAGNVVALQTSSEQLPGQVDLGGEAAPATNVLSFKAAR